MSLQHILESIPWSTDTKNIIVCVDQGYSEMFKWQFDSKWMELSNIYRLVSYSSCLRQYSLLTPFSAKKIVFFISHFLNDELSLIETISTSWNCSELVIFTTTSSVASVSCKTAQSIVASTTQKSTTTTTTTTSSTNISTSTSTGSISSHKPLLDSTNSLLEYSLVVHQLHRFHTSVYHFPFHVVSLLRHSGAQVS